MLVLILLVAAMLAIVCYKTKRMSLFQCFRGISMVVLIIIASVVGYYSYRTADLRNYRQKLETVQENMRLIRKESIESDSLNRERFDELLENFLELKDKEQEYKGVIEDMTAQLEKEGVKEKIEFLLFFNLFKKLKLS